MQQGIRFLKVSGKQEGSLHESFGRVEKQEIAMPLDKAKPWKHEDFWVIIKQPKRIEEALFFSKMETASRKDAMQPALKIGIPAAVISVAGFICARIMARKSVLRDRSLSTQVSSLNTNPLEAFTDEDSFHSLPSTCIFSMEDGEPVVANASLVNMVEDLDTGEVLRLRSQIEELEEKEWEIERQFLRYCDLKEQESMIMELKHVLLLEKAHVEFLDREISWLKTQNEILDNLVLQYTGVLEQLEHWKSENERFKRSVKRLLRRIRQQSRVIREQNVKIEAREATISRNCAALETRDEVIKNLEEEIRELHMFTDQMQEEKIELTKKLEMAEKSAASIEIEEEGLTKEAYNQLENELQQLQKERAAEVKELIFLRWSNACLRHELMRSHDEKRNHSDLLLEGCRETGDSGIEHEDKAGFLVESSEHGCSKRGNLLERLRRWVEGSEKARGRLNEKRRHESKCFGRHSESDAAEEDLARSSCTIADSGL